MSKPDENLHPHIYSQSSSRSVYNNRMCQGISNKYPVCEEQHEFSHKPCARQGRQNANQKVISLCLSLSLEQIPEEKFLKLDCAVSALRKRYFEPEFNLEKRFQQTMKRKKIKAHLNRILFKSASTTTDKLLENHARRQHEIAMEDLRRERPVKIDRMYCLLETSLYLFKLIDPLPAVTHIHACRSPSQQSVRQSGQM